MLFSLLYELLLIVLAISAFPRVFYDFIFKGKYRKNLLKRFGAGFPIIEKGDRPLVWIHAVSLGETKAVAALARKVKKDLKNPIIVFSTTTETGYVEACRSISADHHVYLPLDFGWVINPIIRRTAPNIVLLCESDFWYNFLRVSKKVGARVAIVNGKLSTKSMMRFQKFPFFTKKLFSLVDLFCVQSTIYRKRLELIGVPNDKIVISGNMKFDRDLSIGPSVNTHEWKNELGIDLKDPVVVLGSSHAPEEMICLKAMQKVWARHPNVKILFVPRHPERFNEVAGLLQKNNINFRRLSQKRTQGDVALVILIDAMGLLKKCYQLATLAIVGGSYTQKVGGHNILEPCWYGVPVIFGPHMHAQPELADLVKEYGAGRQVSADQLSDTIVSLLDDRESCQQIGAAGLKLMGDVHGATEKTWNAILRSQKEITVFLKDPILQS